jgi:hypothetical protein
MSESKEVARRIIQWCGDNRGWGSNDGIVSNLAEAFDALNITFAPPVPEGSVKVRIAVVRGVNADGGVETYLKDADEGNPKENELDDDTHRGIVEAWIPPIAPTPTVAGRVV